MTVIYKPIFLDTDGVKTVLPDGGITNIGGVSGTSFSVNGRGLIFDDGGSSNGGPGLTLQTAYDQSTDIDGYASIKLATGKDFVIYDDTNNNVFFKIDSETGKVTITGDVDIIGESTIINTPLQQADHWLIQTTTGVQVSLQIEPAFGVSNIADLINVRTVWGGTPVFRVDNLGNAYFKNVLVSDGTVNGINIVTLNNFVHDHTTTTVTRKHYASEIGIVPSSIPSAPTATNVQQVLEAISIKVEILEDLRPPIVYSNIYGYNIVQDIPSNIWNLNHNKDSLNVTVTIYDDSNSQIFPDKVQIIDTDNIRITFGALQTGRLLLTVFGEL